MPNAPSSPALIDIDIDAVRAAALSCTKCRLAAGRTQVVWAAGNLEADLLFIGEAPGFHEDREGEPFVGAAGQLLDKLLGEIELDRTKAAIVNVIKCRPPSNRDPQEDEIEACRPYLEAQIGHMAPRVIVTLGNFATKFILESSVGITRARGRKYRRLPPTVLATPGSCDSATGLENELGREVAQCDDHPRSHMPYLGLQIGTAGLYLILLRVAVGRGPALDHVDDRGLRPIEFYLAQQLVQQLARGPDERLALTIFVEPGRLPNEQKVGLEVAGRPHHLGPAGGEPALGARQCGGTHRIDVDVDERRRAGGIRHECSIRDVGL